MIGPVHALAGYLVAYISLKMLKNREPHDGVLAAILGAVPDVDYISPLPFGTPFGHHGVTHSPSLLVLASVPFLAKYRRKAAPYFLALTSHIVADFVDNTVPLLAPFSWEEFGLRFSLSSSTLPLAHSIQLFITMISAYVMVKGKKQLPISLPERYDKLATPALMLLALVVPFLPWLMHKDIQFFINLSVEPYFAVSIVLVISSLTLVFLILMLNSKLLVQRLKHYCYSLNRCLYKRNNVLTHPSVIYIANGFPNIAQGSSAGKWSENAFQ
ncbi:MAG: metal-dependent hydrolase [Thermoproteota archaeon]